MELHADQSSACKYGRMRGNPVAVELFDQLTDAPHVSAETIAAVLTAENQPVGASTVKKHRRHTCGCFLGPKPKEEEPSD